MPTKVESVSMGLAYGNAMQGRDARERACSAGMSITERRPSSRRGTSLRNAQGAAKEKLLNAL